MLPLRAVGWTARSALRPAFLAPCARLRMLPGGRLYSTDTGPGSRHDEPEPPDHRKLGAQQELFMTSIYSPGSPIFLPNGTRIFNRLVDFLRRQYVHYGFEEVITPNIYKKSLWEVSGHLENYADDMYTVTSRARQPEAQAQVQAQAPSCCGGGDRLAEGQDDDYGLKPMNCPGHCLIFASKTRSYRDLPIRYADFSALHRNEVSGALTGLTRVRRFHQDDGHIFCRPVQIQPEVFRTLDFMKSVYDALGLGGYSLALSTRPADHYIGTDAEWARAEAQLRGALEQAGLPYEIKEGDGAFYGPKIDVMLRDSNGKTHQAGTIQLDFQLPQRFGLEYQAPAPELEAQGKSLEGDDAAAAKETYGPVTPVLVHRAILGSVERLMALLIEEYDGRWPFWLNPRQAVVLTLNDTEPVLRWADKVRDTLVGHDGRSEEERNRTQPSPTGFTVDVDASTRPLGEKLAEAKSKNYGLVLVVGKQNVEKGTVTLNKREKKEREDLAPEDLLGRMREMVENYQ